MVPTSAPHQKKRDPIFRPVWALFLSGLFVFSTMPIQALRVRFYHKKWWNWPARWHRFVARRCNINVKTKGNIVTDRPVLYVANHLSWADIFVLGANCPNASFVAKGEMENWPLVGKIAGLQFTQFVDRSRRTDAMNQRNRLLASVHAGRNLIIFPEGTTTHGNTVGDFKSALFSVAEEISKAEKDFVIQPVTLSYAEAHGMPIVRARRSLINWMGSIGMGTHFRQHFRHGPVRALLEFHEPVHFNDFGSRKDLALYCQHAVQKGLERAHKGFIRDISN